MTKIKSAKSSAKKTGKVSKKGATKTAKARKTPTKTLKVEDLTDKQKELLMSEYTKEANKLWNEFKKGVSQYNPSVKISSDVRDHIRNRGIKANLEGILLIRPEPVKQQVLRDVAVCARHAGVISSSLAFETDREINTADYNKAEDIVRVLQTGKHTGGRLCD